MRNAKRAGFSMVETIASVAILSLLVIAMGRVSMVRANNQESVDAQYSVLADDAFMADIYKDFHDALTYSFVESPGGQKILTFVLPDGSSNTYSLDPAEEAIFKNGVYQFQATRFDVLGTPVNITVNVKLPDERLLDFTIYR